MNNNNNFTRGAQLWAHNIRMIVQGLKNVCIIGSVFVFLLIVIRITEYLSLKTLYYFVIERYAQIKLVIGSLFYSNIKMWISFYSLAGGNFIHLEASEFIHKFWFITEYGPKINSFIIWCQQSAFVEVIVAFIMGCFISGMIFVYRGSQVLGVKKLRGSELVSVAQIRSMLQRTGMASKIRISGLPLVKDTETQHLLLTGTTGAGKTNMLNELLTQIRLRENRAIIFDATGEFVDRFFNPETDIILNPLTKQSVSWLPWNDCHSDEEYNNLAAAFVDGESITSDRYWEDAARSVLAEAFKKEINTKNISSMLRTLSRISLTDFSKHFADTDAAAYVSKEAEKGTASVRATLLHKIERLKYLKNGGKFSIKKWVNNQNANSGWLFITSTPNELDTLRPLISAWANIAIKGMLDRPYSAQNEKMWFIMDELPSLQKIPSLAMVLAQGRKYGACIVAGIQNIAQLDRIYGRSGSQELLDLFRTKFFFAVSDNHIAEYASRALGEMEIEEAKESLSYGSNTMRDGVNINSAVKINRLVLPDEIKNLESRTCYVKLCGNYPVTKLKVKLQVQHRVIQLFYKIFSKENRFSTAIEYDKILAAEECVDGEDIHLNKHDLSSQLEIHMPSQQSDPSILVSDKTIKPATEKKIKKNQI